MGWLGDPWVRTAGYAVAAALALLAARREQQWTRRPGLWPAFWYLSAAVLGAMALARAVDLDSLLGDLGRDRARDLGWYGRRRGYQASVVGAIGVGWTVAVALALWLVPERRRRYLPAAIVTFSIMCYSAIRLISLHQVDAVLYRQEVGGVPAGALAELLLLMMAVALPLRVVLEPEPAATRAATAGGR